MKKYFVLFCLLFGSLSFASERDEINPEIQGYMSDLKLNLNQKELRELIQIITRITGLIEENQRNHLHYAFYIHQLLECLSSNQFEVVEMLESEKRELLVSLMGVVKSSLRWVESSFEERKSLFPEINKLYHFLLKGLVRDYFRNPSSLNLVEKMLWISQELLKGFSPKAKENAIAMITDWS